MPPKKTLKDSQKTSKHSKATLKKVDEQTTGQGPKTGAVGDELSVLSSDDYEPDPIKPTQPIGQLRSQSQRGNSTTNSLDREGNSLRKRGRETVDTEELPLPNVKDHSVIAIFSREAALNFGKNWRAKMEQDEPARVTPSSKKDVGSEASLRLDKQETSVVGPDFEAQVQALLKNKSIPHVIAVIEGPEEVAHLKTKNQVEGEPIEIPYTKVHFKQGTMVSGKNDDKQNMTFYVRKDLVDAYSFTDETVQNGKHRIPCVGVNYATKDGTSYRSLVVHIPNVNVGSQLKEKSANQAFEKYAETELKKGVVVTGYQGDTNYQKPMQERSVASMGGHLPTGGTLNPQGSGAKDETNFMQSSTLGKKNADAHRVMQPSTLNYVFINTDEQHRTATDHPSIMTYTAHSSEIKGRKPENFPEYYPEDHAKPISSNHAKPITFLERMLQFFGKKFMLV